MKSQIKIAKTKATMNDEKEYPIVNVDYLGKNADVAVAENYGIHGSVPQGTLCVLLTIGNDEANRIIIPLSAQTRTRNLKEGEFECGNFVIGSIIKFDEDGNITVTSINDININSANDINIVAASGNINVTGDIHVTGGIDTTDDVVAGTISLKTHLHGGVTTGGSNTGVPV